MTTPRFIVRGSDVRLDADKVISVSLRAIGFDRRDQVAAHADCPKCMQVSGGRLCRSVSITYVRESVGAWDIEAEFLDITYLPPNQDDPEHRARPVISRRLVPVKVWRIDAIGNRLAFPADSGQPDPDTDIGGLAIDVCGTEVDRPLHTHELTFEVPVQQPLPELLWDALIGTRNLRTWRGYPKGSVLFVGVGTSGGTNDRTHRATLEFAVDPWLHLRQTPAEITGDGRIVSTHADEETDWRKAGQARSIRWFQPFPLLADFSLLGV